MTWRRGLRWLIMVLLALIIVVLAAMLAVDTAPGRRFLIDRVEQLAPESGLRIKVGRIEGSIYGKARLRNLELHDTKGRFLHADTVDLDWQPWRLVVRNALDINTLIAPRVMWERMPELKRSDPPRPMLPDFDIRIGALRIDELTLGPAIAGEQRVARVEGSADIRAGRAMVKADARLRDGADRIVIDLDARPDDKLFALTADVTAPAGGVLARMGGFDETITAAVRGNADAPGIWSGALVAKGAGGRSVADVDIVVRDAERIRLNGTVDVPTFTDGMLARMAPNGATISADGTFVARRWDGAATATTDTVRVGTTGRVDLAANRFDALRVDARLLRPAALMKGMDGRDVRIRALIDGPMASPRAEYLVDADQLRFGRTVLSGVNARGVARQLPDRTLLPVALRVARVSGNGPMAEQLLGGLRADGTLTLKNGILTSDRIAVQSARINGHVVVLANLNRGTYDVAFNGALPGYEIPGLGRIDLTSDLKVVPAAGGGTAVQGTARAVVRRLDNGFFRTLTGGLPVLETGVRLGPDGVLRLPNLVLRSPLLTLRADGYRRADGTFQFTGSGHHRDYGPVTATIDGPIDRPRVALVLARPVPSAGLAGVKLNLIPSAAGYAYTAAGQSTLGPFTSVGTILLPRGGQTVIAIDRVTVAGTSARGRLVPVTGGLAGTMDVAGGGLDGTLKLAVVGGVQEIATNLVANNARFPGPPPITLRKGRVVATIRLVPNAMTVDAAVTAEGFRRGSLSLARLAGSARMIGGRGFVRGSFVGTRGRDIAVQFLAKVAPGAIDLDAGGSIAGRPVRLEKTAMIRATRDGGWRFSDVVLLHGGGKAEVDGVFGGQAMALDATLNGLPINLLDIVWPDNRLGGRISGTVRYADAGAAPPTGIAELKIAGLSRTGLSGTIKPVDVAMNAALTRDSMAVRATFGDSGKTFGRMQMRVHPLPAGGTLAERVMRAPMFAQVRYGGQVEPLWAMTGIPTLAISGPVQIGADLSGTLANPQVRGAMRTENARVESIQSGTVLTDVRAVGRFDGSRLDLIQLAGKTKGDGTVTGTGQFLIAPEQRFPFDIRLQANRALLIERDDFVARVTGPIRMQSGASGGLISGDVRLDSGTFRLGRATAANALPVVRVVERNTPTDLADPPMPTSPWRLALNVDARNQFTVTGMGLESEWAAGVQVGGTLAEMRIVGEADLVRGDYTFAGRRFALEEGHIRFTGRNPVDPSLDIRAVSDITGLDATITIGGTGQRPDIRFSSVPALPEDELLSRILFGSSITDISVAEAAQLAASVASLRGGSGSGLDPINALRRGLGLDRLRILPANTALGSGTSVAAGKYITRRLFVEIVTDGQGYSATRAEYQVTRWLSILSAISTVGRQSVNVRVSKDY